MEILIPGLALVALMIYASTKIKKAAAAALEAEDVETDEFVLTKPVGFVNIASPDNARLFHAYTKEFAPDAPRFRKAEITICVREDADANQVFDELKQSHGNVAYERMDDEGGFAPETFRVDRDEDGVRLFCFIRLLQKNGRVYQLRFDTPEDHKDEFSRAVREVNESFRLKN